MILSVSRRTDIPAFYSEWFFRRLQERNVLIRNPMNPRLVSSVSLDPQVIDGIVFWTKNPSKMLKSLHLLEDYAYYFQVTINSYGRAVEPGLPPQEEILASFKRLSTRIGNTRMIWRYDPILITQEFDEEFHAREFSKLARTLAGYTKRCVLSFLDLYRKTERNMKPLGPTFMSEEIMLRLAGILAPIAQECGLLLETCSEEIDLLNPFGIRHGKCIDPDLISDITGHKLNISKDPNQRPECGCVASIDLGAYNTCSYGCLYCYANFNPRAVAGQVPLHDPISPLLIGELTPRDRVVERKVRSLVAPQSELF